MAIVLGCWDRRLQYAHFRHKNLAVGAAEAGMRLYENGDIFFLIRLCKSSC